MTAAAEPARAAGSCSWCGEWAASGVVIAEMFGDSGPGAVIVRHDEHIGLRRPVAQIPRTYPA